MNPSGSRFDLYSLLEDDLSDRLLDGAVYLKG
jgi:hypothetical protein